MVKGYKGETCAEAMREAIGLLGNRASAQDIFDKVREKGNWKDNQIWLVCISRTINLPPSYGYFPKKPPEDRFLFLREDGDYELYQPVRHGRYEQGRRIA